jgi:hypothetical protein
MGEIVGFVSKSELERLGLIRKARAIYDSIFPPADPLSERPDGGPGKSDPSQLEEPPPSTRNVGKGACSPSIAIFSSFIAG